MRLKTLENGMRVYLAPDDYELLLDVADSRRVYCAMRVMGECSLRVGTLDDIYLEDIREAEVSGTKLRFLPIYAKDTKDRDTDGKRRDVWIPKSVYRDLVEYAEIEGISEDMPLFPVSTRTIQEDMIETRQNAVRKTGNEDFKQVTCHDFRAYFATNMLLRKGVDIETVMELGGWESRETMDPYLSASFDDIIADSLAAAGVLESDFKTEPSALDRLRQEVTAIREAVENLRPGVTVDRPNAQQSLQDFGD